MSDIIHIVFGGSAGGILKQAIRPKKTLMFMDVFDGGPIVDFASLEKWISSRKPYWAKIVPDLDYDSPFWCAGVWNNDIIADLQRSDEIVLWVGAAAREQIIIPWFIRLFKSCGIDASKLRLLEVYEVKGKNGETIQICGSGELNPGQLRSFYDAGRLRTLTAEDLTELEHAWNSITSPNPQKLCEYYSNKHPRFPFLHKGIRCLMQSYPHKRNGLNFYESQLVKYCMEVGPVAARVIGHTMAWSLPDNSIGDAYLLWRIQELGDDKIPYPAFSITGERTEMRNMHITLTEYGKKYLKNDANFSQLNGIDYWVGGVHLTPKNGIWYYDNDNLTRLTA